MDSLLTTPALQAVETVPTVGSRLYKIAHSGREIRAPVDRACLERQSQIRVKWGRRACSNAGNISSVCAIWFEAQNCAASAVEPSLKEGFARRGGRGGGWRVSIHVASLLSQASLLMARGPLPKRLFQIDHK